MANSYACDRQQCQTCKGVGSFPHPFAAAFDAVIGPLAERLFPGKEPPKVTLLCPRCDGRKTVLVAEAVP